MKRTEIIAQIRSLRESQADFVRTNGDDLLGLVDNRGRQIHGLWEFDSFRRCELYDNETDCRNQTHGAYDDWEALRKIQEKGESDNAES